MDKDQFKIQVYHNRYTRGVVVTICKILIWSLIYALIVTLLGSAMAASAGVVDDLNTLNAYSYNPVNIGAGVVIPALIIVAVTIAYYWAVISAILRKIKQNKQLTEMEEEFLGNKNSSKK